MIPEEGFAKPSKIQKLNYMSMNKMKSKDFLNTIGTLHLSMTFGIVIASLVAYYFSLQDINLEIIPEESMQIVQWLLVLVTIAFIAVSQYLKSTGLASINRETDLAHKLPKYQSVMLKKLAILEGIALLLVIMYFLSSNTFFLVLASVMVISMLVDYPSKNKIIQELQLDDEESAKINDPECYVS